MESIPHVTYRFLTSQVYVKEKTKKGHTYPNGKNIWFANILKNNNDLVIGQLRFVFRYVQKGEEFD